jgi:hypothetical protein
VDGEQELDRGQKVELDGRQEVDVKLDGRQEVDVKLDGVQEVDGGPEVKSVQNGRQKVEVDGEQNMEQDVVGGQEVNRRQRRVGDEYAMGGIRPQSRRNSCRHQVCIAYKRVICDVCD